MKEMKGYKKYRIDSFSDKKHDSCYFDDEDEAVAYGRELTSKGKIAFLLEHLIDEKYDVVAEIK